MAEINLGLRLASVLLALFALVGCVWVAFALVGGYMAWSGATAPGQLIFPDELAPSSSDAILEVVEGLALIAISLALRTSIRRTILRNRSAAG